jgi:hypothetical protein
MAGASRLFAVEAAKIMQTMMDIALNRFYQILHRMPHYNVQISFSLVRLQRFMVQLTHAQPLGVLCLRENWCFWQWF